MSFNLKIGTSDSTVFYIKSDLGMRQTFFK